MDKKFDSLVYRKVEAEAGVGQVWDDHGISHDIPAVQVTVIHGNYGTRVVLSCEAARELAGQLMASADAAMDASSEDFLKSL